MEHDEFTDVKTVIEEPLKFKLKLAIGEDAYGSLRLVNRVGEYWDNYGWATTGAAAAKTGIVATTFFAPTGLLGALGIGAAVTPVGWVIAAAVLTGGAAIGVKRFLNETSDSRVAVIPKFINTPIDLLAISLFDLIAPLALKVAAIDGHITDDERKWIKGYFINEWGYDGNFLDAGFKIIESKLDEFTIKELAASLAEFSKKNPDCNYPVMARDLVEFLKGVMEADGIIDEKEELAIEKIEAIFKEAERTFTKNNLVNWGGDLVNSAKKTSKTLVNSEPYSRASDTFLNTKDFAKKGINDTLEKGKKIASIFFNKDKIK